MRAFAFLIALSALAAAPVAAEPASVTVIVLKGELSTPDGLKRTQRRIEGVIEQLCRSYAVVESYQVPEVDECRRQAKVSAERQIARHLERDSQVLLSGR